MVSLSVYIHPRVSFFSSPLLVSRFPKSHVSSKMKDKTVISRKKTGAEDSSATVPDRPERRRELRIHTAVLSSCPPLIPAQLAFPTVRFSLDPGATPRSQKPPRKIKNKTYKK